MCICSLFVKKVLIYKYGHFIQKEWILMEIMINSKDEFLNRCMIYEMIAHLDDKHAQRIAAYISYNAKLEDIEYILRNCINIESIYGSSINDNYVSIIIRKNLNGNKEKLNFSFKDGFMLDKYASYYNNQMLKNYLKKVSLVNFYPKPIEKLINELNNHTCIKCMLLAKGDFKVVIDDNNIAKFIHNETVFKTYLLDDKHTNEEIAKILKEIHEKEKSAKNISNQQKKVGKSYDNSDIIRLAKLLNK